MAQSDSADKQHASGLATLSRKPRHAAVAVSGILLVASSS